ncbi:hypothetical protein MMC31_001230 [Peltigera leucophlebia]|nr:hypothetical protein [Peltigera leucophlebia]
MIALVIEESGQKSIDEFQTWIAQSDWPSAIKQTQEQYLRPYYIQKVRANAKKKIEAEVIATLSNRKEEWLGSVEERDTPEPEPNWDDIKKKIYQSTNIQNRDIVRENSLLITSLSLLYIDFAEACCTGHSGRIEQCIRCFAVIFQTTRSTKYAREMMHIVACFKRLWKKEMKDAWLESCLINISGWPNKFIPDDRFDEIIIMLNKENINPSANAKSDKFLWETVSQNVLSLCNSKETLSQATGLTSHGNRHSIVSSYPDVCYLVKLLTNEAVFNEQLRRGNSESDLPDLFANGSALLARGVLLTEYIISFRGSWVLAGPRPQGDDNVNDMAVGNEDADTDTVEGRGREMEMDYN